MASSMRGSGTFITGIDIFDEKEQGKLAERAKRFALKPEDIHSFTDQDLQDLYDSLGVNTANESEVKFKSIHLFGLEDMTVEDIVEYFASYSPEGIEWVDSNSCNVVWLDSLSAARALHFKSKVIIGMPAREPRDTFPKDFIDDIDELETGQSILLKNRDVEMQDELGKVFLPKPKPENAVDISEITIPIPPGYWRLANAHPRTKCMLVRFGRVTDKLPFKSEKCSKYYKRLTSQKNFIPESKKKELKTIFERNKDLVAPPSKNPWGSLARNWDEDSQFREKEPVVYQLSDDDDEVVEVKSSKLLSRLGTKRKVIEKNSKPANSLHADDESEKKRTKVPRMKMYADEEEENQKRRRILMKIQNQKDQIDKNERERDLRDILGHTNSKLISKKDIDHNVDLGTKLKNRNKRMVFAVDRSPFEHLDYLYPDDRNALVDARRDLMSDRRDMINERRDLLKDRIELRSRDRESSGRHRSVLIKPASEVIDGHKSHRSSRRRTPERTMHSDRMHSSKPVLQGRRRRKSRSSEKPRSKVSVVVRTPKKPTVASTVWSKVSAKSSPSGKSTSKSESDESNSSSNDSSGSSSGSDSDSEESDGDSSSSHSSTTRTARNPDRPGFDKRRLSRKIMHKSPLKITTTNELYTRKRQHRF
ncbi:hypothetical protein HUJ04_006709 [Dendroctonus ponderosae]|uniref:Nuclear cap-binding protein subunit 3 n=1 Tax=Dendroctonus ponderosae TaxID=77166 RepID=A0AAR5Q3E7_DENPD|nr:hypothetical protein HUJ04_006709 [Dendroctonus ponderosae]